METPILFYTEDNSDGTFPVKSCRNCFSNVKLFSLKSCSNRECASLDYRYWQGDIEGNPIRKGDKCWRVYLSINNTPNIYFGEWELIKTGCSKYFSNETNARNYFNTLSQK